MIDDKLPPLREVIGKYNLRAKKNLGQNFLLDLNITNKIAKSAGELSGFTIIEVGAGPGGLTRALLKQGAKKIIAIEKDERAKPALMDIANIYPNKIELICADALKIDYASLANGPTKIIANLPYNIATKLLIKWLTKTSWPPFFSSLTLMFQKEVAQRICAKFGDKDYGRLSILCAWLTDTKILFNIEKSAFTPEPKITSSLVELVPKPIDKTIQITALEDITRAAFSKKRKMVRQSLKGLKIPAEELIKIAGISGTERAEQLPLNSYLKMAKALSKY